MSYHALVIKINAACYGRRGFRHSSGKLSDHGMRWFSFAFSEILYTIALADAPFAVLWNIQFFFPKQMFVFGLEASNDGVIMLLRSRSFGLFPLRNSSWWCFDIYLWLTKGSDSSAFKISASWLFMKLSSSLFVNVFFNPFFGCESKTNRYLQMLLLTLWVLEILQTTNYCVFSFKLWYLFLCEYM